MYSHFKTFLTNFQSVAFHVYVLFGNWKLVTARSSTSEHCTNLCALRNNFLALRIENEYFCYALRSRHFLLIFYYFGSTYSSELPTSFIFTFHPLRLCTPFAFIDFRKIHETSLLHYNLVQLMCRFVQFCFCGRATQKKRLSRSFVHTIHISIFMQDFSCTYVQPIPTNLCASRSPFLRVLWQSYNNVPTTKLCAVLLYHFFSLSNMSLCSSYIAHPTF